MGGTGAVVTAHKPFSYRKTKKVRITSAGMTFQLSRMPWPSPVGKRGRIVNVTVDNFNGVAATVRMWDSDESSTTPPKRGSAGAALVEVGVAAANASGVGASQTVRGEGELPREVFRGGIAVQATQLNVQVAAEIEYY